MAKTPHIIDVQGITKHYVQGETTLEVLRGITVSFVQGRSYAITGVSGSGKSTFIHMLAGIDTPDAGDIFFNKKLLHAMSPSEREFFRNQSIGLIFQRPYLVQELSVQENVMLKGLIGGKDYKECSAEAMELLQRVGLVEKAAEYPAKLSGGQQQRVALARALFNKPAFLVADEPTGNLDHATAATILEFLLECQRSWSMGLIMSSHDPFIATSLQETWHMSDGRLHKKHE